jgi:hypothetical protein
LLFYLELELPFLIIYSPPLELLLLELLVSLLLFPFFKVLEVVRPLVRAFLALLVLIVHAIFLGIGCIDGALRLGSKLARIFILVRSSCVMVIAPFEDI